MNELNNVPQTMSSREIAQLTNKEHKNVLRDIENLNINYEKLALLKIEPCEYKAENGQTYREFRLTKMQTFDLLTGYNAELRIKVNRRWAELEEKQIKPLSQLEILAQSAQILLEQDRRINQVQEQVNLIEAKLTTRPEYFTVAGYATLQKIDCGLKLASSLGRKASKLCKERGIETEEIPDPRFGLVKTYPTHILKEVFDLSITA